MDKDTLASTRHLDDDVLVGRLQISCTPPASAAAADDHMPSAAAAVPAAEDCALSAATEVTERQHGEGAELQLLDLPDTLLHPLARLMGKRARLLCSQLRQAYGPPGAILALSDPMPTPQASAAPPPTYKSQASAAPPPTYKSVLQSWRHPVRRLLLASDSRAARGICFDAPLSLLVAAALPHLLELKCDRLNLGGEPTPLHATPLHATPLHATPLHATPLDDTPLHATPLTALTSLEFKQDLELGPHALHSLPALAPRLRLLRMSYRPVRLYLEQPHRFIPSGDSLWGALAALRGLQSVDVPGRLASSALYTDLQRLTALTHLGLDVMNAWARPSAASLLRLTGALGALPALASVRFVDFPALGPSLGAALQALPALQRVELLSPRDCAYAGDEHLPHSSLPDIGAMPRLEHLTLSGHRVFAPAVPHGVGSAGRPWALRSLELGATSAQQCRAACALVAGCFSLTRLVLYVLDFKDVSNRADGDWEAAGLLLGQALPLNPRLEHLEVCWGMGGFTPSLAGLRSLTCLALEGWSDAGDIDPFDLMMVAALSSLRKLVLLGVKVPRASIEAVRKLPQLEDAALWGAGWMGDGGELLQLLLPPPPRLTRLVLGARMWAGSQCNPHPYGARAVSRMRGAVEQLARYDVAVVESHSLVEWRGLANLTRGF